ncbi:hypothetical protein SD77_1607 [Bacillus badius]|uniref:Uncharacterized protein n=1 Tax=Bacillus badius TaxID=1455 RepID=A0ABR5ART7_BACBA|nr:hypothetical protein SD77_1607 [Bacillus badius]
MVIKRVWFIMHLYSNNTRGMREENLPENVKLRTVAGRIF